jgi:transcriptional regulator with XRE-family HTH domain
MDRRQKFGAKLQDIRIMRGLSVEEVAAGTGFKGITIKNIESGRFSAPFDVIDKIAQFFGMELTIK